MAKLATVTANDYKQLSLFLATFQDEPRDSSFWRERFKLWWDNNPAFSEEIERGWVLIEEENIVGFLGITPSFFQLSNRQIVIHNATTWRVLPEYRDSSLSLLYRQIQSAKETILINTTPNAVVYKILNMLHFQPLPTMINREWVLVINYHKYVKKALKGLGNTPISPLFIKPCAALLNAYQSFKLSGFGDSGINHVKQVDKADRSFDDLWERTKEVYANTNVRNAKAINWFCFDNKDYEKTVFGYYQSGKLLGYIILRNSDNGKVLHCLDLWTEPNRDDVISGLINYARQYAQEVYCDTIRLAYFNKTLGDYYGKVSLFHALADEKKDYYKAATELADKISEDNSYFVLGQGDYGI
ncbi:MAG: hypothetical protein GXP10_06370 [Gammaproteobacteria bacterium]|nr:hypothetical protein [Gammaproteobacteria bacterium]